MTSLPITYVPPPAAPHNKQHVLKFRIVDAAQSFPELGDFQRVYEEKELIEAENEARDRKKNPKAMSGKGFSQFAQQMKEEKEPLNHYDREAIIAADQGTHEYLCSVTSNAQRVDEVDPSAVVMYSRKKPEAQFVTFVAVVRSDGIQLMPVTGNMYEAKRRPSTSGRRNMDRRQHDGEREKKEASEMLRQMGAHHRFEEHEKDVSRYVAAGSNDDVGENMVDDLNRRLDITSGDLDIDAGEGHDGAGFEDPKADTLEDEARDEAAVEGIDRDIDGELDKIQGNPEDPEASAAPKKTEEKKSDKKRNRADLEGTIESKLRAGSLSAEQAKKWIKDLQEEFDVTQEQLKDTIMQMTQYRGEGASKELMLKQKAAAGGGAKKHKN